MSIKPDSLRQPKRSAGFLFKNPLSTEDALTDSDLGIRIVFSKITVLHLEMAKQREISWYSEPYHRGRLVKASDSSLGNETKQKQQTRTASTRFSHHTLFVFFFFLKHHIA